MSIPDSCPNMILYSFIYLRTAERALNGDAVYSWRYSLLDSLLFTVLLSFTKIIPDVSVWLQLYGLFLITTKWTSRKEIAVQMY